jgi:hypothetical protein
LDFCERLFTGGCTGGRFGFQGGVDAIRGLIQAESTALDGLALVLDGDPIN